MAEAIARDWLAKHDADCDSDIFVASAGVAASDGMPVSPETLAALRDLGIEHHGASKRLTADMAEKASVILCMTTRHAEAVRALTGAVGSIPVIWTLDPAGDVSDPIGMGQDAYDALAARLTEIIPQRLKEALEHENRARVGSSG